jgi:hypothetical protein
LNYEKQISNLALIEMISFCCGVHSKRYNAEQDKWCFENGISAPEKITEP